MSHSSAGTLAGAQRRDQATLLSGTARLLGLSGAQLRFALSAGTTLGQLAAHMGVSTAELRDRLNEDLEADAQSLPDGELDRIAAAITAAPPEPRPRRRIDAYA